MTLKKDIEKLIEIHRELEDHYDDCEFDLCEEHKVELNRITNTEDFDWDDNCLKFYISGMQRALQLQRIYDEKMLKEVMGIKRAKKRLIGDKE